jgi:hypothetical protein
MGTRAPIESVKWLEYLVQFFGGDSRAIVRDGDKRFVPRYGAPYAYLDARWCVCAHICEQIQQQLLQAPGIPDNREVIRDLYLDLVARFSQKWLDSANRAPHDVTEVNAIAIQLLSAHLQLIVGQQITN